MKKLLTIVLASLFLFSCKEKDSFTISGTITNPGSLKTVYLLLADTGGVVTDSTNLSEQGKFQFKRSSPYPNMFKLRVGSYVFDMIAKNGDAIDFTTNLTDSLHMYQISGSEESEKIKEFNNITNPFVAKTTRLYDEYELKAQEVAAEPDSVLRTKKTDELLAKYRPMFLRINDTLSQTVLKFVNDNKTSLAGFYAATSLDSIKYEQQLVEYAEAIKDEFKDNTLVKRFVQQKMLIKPITLGQKAPEFNTTGLNGKPVKLSDYKGKFLLIDFWASWCQPCRLENPNVVKLYNTYHAQGLNILGISLDIEKANWQKAINADKLVWDHASDLKNFEGPVESLYHIYQLPTNFIIDQQGVIIGKNLFGPELEDFLKKTFSKPQQIVKN